MKHLCRIISKHKNNFLVIPLVGPVLKNPNNEHIITTLLAFCIRRRSAGVKPDTVWTEVPKMLSVGLYC